MACSRLGVDQLDADSCALPGETNAASEEGADAKLVADAPGRIGSVSIAGDRRAAHETQRGQPRKLCGDFLSHAGDEVLLRLIGRDVLERQDREDADLAVVLGNGTTRDHSAPPDEARKHRQRERGGGKRERCAREFPSRMLTRCALERGDDIRGAGVPVAGVLGDAAANNPEERGVPTHGRRLMLKRVRVKDRVQRVD